MDKPGKTVRKKRPRRTFTPEFKAEAVRLCRVGDRSIAQVAKDLDQLPRLPAAQMPRSPQTSDHVRPAKELLDDLASSLAPCVADVAPAIACDRDAPTPEDFQ